MKIQHILLAILVSAIWGLSFLVVKIGLAEYPPFLLASLRFTLVFICGIFLFKKPDLPFKQYAKVACYMGIIQFSGLFCAIKLGLPAGIVSVLAQLQVFITIALASILNQEKLSNIHK